MEKIYIYDSDHGYIAEKGEGARYALLHKIICRIIPKIKDRTDDFLYVQELIDNLGIIKSETEKVETLYKSKDGYTFDNEAACFHHENNTLVNRIMEISKNSNLSPKWIVENWECLKKVMDDE